MRDFRRLLCRFREGKTSFFPRRSSTSAHSSVAFRRRLGRWQVVGVPIIRAGEAFEPGFRQVGRRSGRGRRLRQCALSCATGRERRKDRQDSDSTRRGNSSVRRLAASPLRTTHRSAVPTVRSRRLRPKLFYSKLPDDIASSFVFLLDPMIAERILLSSAPCPIHSITIATMRSALEGAVVRVASSMIAPPPLPACQLRCMRGMHAELLKPNQPHNGRTLHTAGSAICAMEVRLRQGSTRRLRLSSRFSWSRATVEPLALLRSFCRGASTPRMWCL